MRLPQKGTSSQALLANLKDRRRADADWRGARLFSLIYPAGPEVEEIVEQACLLYLHENALNPLRFPSLRQLETEVVQMTGQLLHAPEGFDGAMTSGGTESILMAVKSARDRARAERGVTQPEMVAPISAHPAFAKAASYLGIELKSAPLGPDFRADVGAVADLIGERCVLVVGSAPNYPYGVVDPIPELAALAAERGISFHTDACLGGFLLPFWERLGEPVPPFDFRVPGVTTISADVHKYGYCVKGASVILHRDAEHLKRYQRFLYSGWPGGLYLSFAMAGARPAAPIAAAWAVMNHLGEEGYVRLAGRVRKATRRIQAGIAATPGLRLWGDPAMSVFAFGSDEFDIFAVGDRMDERGWHPDRQKGPDALHLMVSPEHDRVADRFVEDLDASVRDRGASKGVEARYS